MITVSVGTSTQRKQIMVSEDKTPAEIFEEENVTYEGAVVYFNGAPIQDKLDTPLKEFTLREGRPNLLTAIIKADSAM